MSFKYDGHWMCRSNKFESSTLHAATLFVGNEKTCIFPTVID